MQHHFKVLVAGAGLICAAFAGTELMGMHLKQLLFLSFVFKNMCVGKYVIVMSESLCLEMSCLNVLCPKVVEPFFKKVCLFLPS